LCFPRPSPGPLKKPPDFLPVVTSSFVRVLALTLILILIPALVLVLMLILILLILILVHAHKGSNMGSSPTILFQDLARGH
jgi:hypothetical protein